MKQTGTAVMIYMSDYDDMVPLKAIIGYDAADPAQNLGRTFNRI
ncbi:MAG: hypothetical protein R2688_01575 [Fimbriimonadaceae bacterium]